MTENEEAQPVVESEPAPAVVAEPVAAPVAEPAPESEAAITEESPRRKFGRPTLYSEELLERAYEYIENLPEDEVVHSIEGLGLYIGISRDTVYEWEKDNEKLDFSDIVSEVRQLQAKTLVNSGLSGKFSSPITKVMLTKHGYREGIDQTSDGKQLPTPILGGITLEKESETEIKSDENEGANSEVQ